MAQFELGIIGFPIGHSISPVFQQAALDALGVDGVYGRWEVPPDGVGEFIRGLRDGGTRGVNVTVPHKEAVIPFLDEVDDWAAAAGAVNTIVRRSGGRLTGHNTDGLGFLRALREEAGFEPAGRNALILGAGGAARGIVLALARAGVRRMVIANRTIARAERLAALSQENGVPASAVSLTPGASEAAADAALIVNCTSMGMLHGPDETGWPLAAGDIPPTALVNDLVYNPLRTPLLRAAEAAGAATLGGLGMLVYQGAASFELWLERPAPTAVMMQAATAEMTARGA